MIGVTLWSMTSDTAAPCAVDVVAMRALAGAPAATGAELGNGSLEKEGRIWREYNER